MEEYGENMKEYVENTKEYVRNAKKYVENMKEYVENINKRNMKKYNDILDLALPYRLWDLEKFQFAQILIEFQL